MTTKEPVPFPDRASGVRCPHCRAKHAEWLAGTARFTCRKCGHPFIATGEYDPAEQEVGDAA